MCLELLALVLQLQLLVVCSVTAVVVNYQQRSCVERDLGILVEDFVAASAVCVFRAGAF